MDEKLFDAFRQAGDELLGAQGKKAPDRQLEVFKQLTPQDFRSLQDRYGEKAVAKYVARMGHRTGGK